MDYTASVYMQSVFFLCQFLYGEVGVKQADGALMVTNGSTFRLLRPYALATRKHWRDLLVLVE
jgi:hypothetical protein